MRTKNLNLKKKIAFIASVAMIATTAAYLPAGSLTAGALVPAISTTGYDSTTDATTSAGVTKVDTFNTFVKVNGKYLAIKGSEYKTFATETAAKNEGYKLINVSNNMALTKSTDPFADSGTALTGAALDANFDTMLAGELTLPYIAEANPTITLEFSAKNGSTLSGRSMTELDVELNDNGVALVPKQTEYVVGKTNDSDYDEVVGNDPAKGAYEILDLSGLLIRMDGIKTANAPLAYDSTSASAVQVVETKASAGNTDMDIPTGWDKNNGAGGNDDIVVDGALIDDEDAEANTYNVKKMGGVYARVIYAELPDAQRVEPGTVVKVNLGNYAAWTPSGGSITGTGANKQLAITMDSNGYAESSLITMTKDSGEKEYYVYVVKNGATAVEKALEAGTSLKLQSFKTDAVTGTKLDADADVKTVKGWNDAAGKYKVKTDVVTARFKDTAGGDTETKEHFVTKYTIYNNEIDDDMDAGSHFKLTLAGTAAGDTVRLAKATALSAAETSGTTTEGTDTKVVVNANVAKDAYVVADGATNTGYVEIAKDSAGTATSAILAVQDKTDTKIGYVQFVFKNEYKIKYTDANADTNPGQTKDGYATVTGGVDISAPTDPTKAGFEFDGWTDGAVTPTTIFAADSNAQVLTGTAAQAVITPNTVLTAKWKGLYYNVKLDAGKGYITSDGNRTSFVPSEYKKYDNTSGLYQIGTFTNIQRDDDLSDDENDDITGKNTTAGGYNGNKVTAVRTGYTFKGWNTDKNATKGLTTKELAKKFPGENKTLELYAIYKPMENIAVDFKEIDIDANSGLALDGNGKASVTTAAGGAWYTNTKASWNKNSDGIKSITVGEKLGSLPTPVKKGYEFEGWYIKKYDSTGANTSAVKVTEDTVFDEEIYDNNNKGKFAAGASLTLYAKFVQKTYGITFDLDGGAWSDTTFDKETSDKPVSYKYVNGNIKFINAAGRVFDVDEAKTIMKAVSVAKGSDNYTTFKGWSINGSSETVTHSSLIATIDDLNAAGDLTIKAVYKKTTQNTSNINIQSNGGTIYNAVFNNKGELTALKDKNGNEIYDAATAAALNAAEEATAAAAGQVAGTSGGSYVADPNYPYSATADADLGITGQSLAGNGPGSTVGGLWNVKNNYIYNVANGSLSGFVAARAGYTFTGWYKDAACTEKYTFDKYPEKGVEDVVYAGWAPATATRYQLKYDLYDADKALIEDSTYGSADTDRVMTFSKTFTGKTGETVDAKDHTVTVTRGTGANSETKKYVFDSVLSDGLKTTTKIDASYDKSALSEGKFIEDSDEYVKIYGRYVIEGSQSQEEVKELGKATNVKVSDAGKVTFTAADNAVKYQVCKIVDGKKYYSAKTDATTINITPAKKDYQVYVIAFDENGKSTHSETVKVTVKATSTLGTVQNPKVTESLDDSGNKIGTVTWDKVEGATWYKVFKVVNGKTYWGSKVTENKYVFKNLPKDSSYIIYVAAGDDKGNVTYGARTKISKYPAVQNVKISADKKTVTFDKAEGAVNYQVAKLINGKTYYGTKSESNSITLQSAAKSGTQIFVLAFFTGEDGKTYSSYSQSITVE